MQGCTRPPYGTTKSRSSLREYDATPNSSIIIAPRRKPVRPDVFFCWSALSSSALSPAARSDALRWSPPQSYGCAPAARTSTFAATLSWFADSGRSPARRRDSLRAAILVVLERLTGRRICEFAAVTLSVGIVFVALAGALTGIEFPRHSCSTGSWWKEGIEVGLAFLVAIMCSRRKAGTGSTLGDPISPA